MMPHRALRREHALYMIKQGGKGVTRLTEVLERHRLETKNIKTKAKYPEAFPCCGTERGVLSPAY